MTGHILSAIRKRLIHLFIPGFTTCGIWHEHYFFLFSDRTVSATANRTLHRLFLLGFAHRRNDPIHEGLECMTAFRTEGFHLFLFSSFIFHCPSPFTCTLEILFIF